MRKVSDFIRLLLNNPLVPLGREWIIARGLYAGVSGDFLTAVHFLIPQLEASLRYLLSQSQVITSGFDDEGIQDEYNINRLLSASEFVEPLAQLFGTARKACRIWSIRCHSFNHRLVSLSQINVWAFPSSESTGEITAFM